MTQQTSNPNDTWRSKLTPSSFAFFICLFAGLISVGMPGIALAGAVELSGLGIVTDISTTFVNLVLALSGTAFAYSCFEMYQSGGERGMNRLSWSLVAAGLAFIYDTFMTTFLA